MSFLLYLLFIVISVLYVRWWIIQKDVAKDIPGPAGLPILGNLITLLIHWNRLQDWIYDMYKIHGTTMVYWFFGGPGKAYILVVEPACVEYVLKTNFNNYVKGEVFHNLMEPLLGNGIFAVDGHLWKKQRQVASHHFSVNSLKAMVDTFVHHGHTVLDILSKTTPKQEVEMQDIFFRYTLDCIGTIAFGKDIGSLHSPQPFATAFDNAQAAIDRAFGNPILAMFPSLNPGLFKNRNIVHQYVHSLIQERRRESADLLKSKTDLLSRYMTLVDEETGEPYSDEYLRDIILNFIMAGRDTTAEMMSWTFHMLSTHPEEQETLFNEIQTNFPNGQDADFDAVNKMTYLKAVLSETLRLYPSVPIDTKEALEDDVLPNGYKVPKGAWIVYSPWVSGRANEYWDNPEVWNPERWIQTPNKPWVFVPFQGGPRICLGQQMAYIEAKTLIAMIIGKYKITAVPGHQVTYKRSLTLPTNGVKVYFESRRK